MTKKDQQQLFNRMIRKYAADNNLTFSGAWAAFRKSFDLTYRTNLAMQVESYKKKHKLKNLSVPSYLARTGKLDEALRIADQLLNYRAG